MGTWSIGPAHGTARTRRIGAMRAHIAGVFYITVLLPAGRSVQSVLSQRSVDAMVGAWPIGPTHGPARTDTQDRRNASA